MIWTIILVVLGVLILFFFGSFLIGGRRGRQARNEIHRIRLEEIPGLAAECRRVSEEKLKTVLDIGNYDECADTLEQWMTTPEMVQAFRKEGFAWYFVKPVGAFYGELIREHIDAEWRPGAGQGPWLAMKWGDETGEIHPFEEWLDLWARQKPGTVVYSLHAAKIWRDVKQSEQEISRIRLEEIPDLAEECRRIFEERLGTVLDIENYDECGDTLDEWMKTAELREAFAREEYPWYFVKPVGAFLGELMRHHTRAEWEKAEGDQPCLRIEWDERNVQAYPFDKVLKQMDTGERGDIVVYLTMARRPFRLTRVGSVAFVRRK